MADSHSTDDSNDPSKKKHSNVFASEKRDASASRSYWTKEKIENAKPIPFPVPKENPQKGNDGEAGEKTNDSLDES